MQLKDSELSETNYLSTLYFAYGANLNRANMHERCPAAIPCGAYYLEGFRLVFRTVADIEPASGEGVHGMLWRITPACLRALDIFEGYPTHYDHWFFELDDGGEVLCYRMNAGGYGVPSRGYYETLRRGYEDFALPPKQLSRAYACAQECEQSVPW